MPIGPRLKRYCYSAGKGVPVDFRRALQLWKAVGDRHPMAINNIADLYETGRGVRQNPAIAARLYRRAADRGLPLAQLNLAKLLEAGRGITKNVAEANEWYARAASQGNEKAAEALTRLGRSAS